MDNFKTVFKRIRDRNEKLYLEMSLRLDDNEDIFNDPKQNKIQYTYISTYGQHVEDLAEFGLPYKLYAYPGFAEQNLALLIHDRVALLVEYNLSDNGIKIRFVNANKSFRNIAAKFFIEYLLPRFSEIVSDNVQTVSAYNFYTNLALKTNNYTTPYEIWILNEKTGDEELVVDIEQMNKNYDDAEGHFDYCYVIKKL